MNRPPSDADPKIERASTAKGVGAASPESNFRAENGLGAAGSRLEERKRLPPATAFRLPAASWQLS